MHNSTDRESYHKKRKRNIIKRVLLKMLSGIARFTIPPSLRIIIYRMMGVRVGKGTFIGLDCIFDSSYPELISIEDNVVTSFRIMLICHGIATREDNTAPGKQDRYVAGITLKRNCYIGAGAIILPGVIVGENAVVAAGAVVTKDVEPYTLVGGIPARKMKTFSKRQV